MKNIAIVTASRADYGIYLPVIKAIKDYPDLCLSLRAVGNPDYLEFPLPREFKRGEENWIIVLGDTMPMLYTAIEAVENNILVAHIHGGDKTGSIDDKIRPAISAFADFHFPSLPEHAERLRQMGIPDNRIKVVGPLGIYAMKDAEFIPEKELRSNLGLSDKPVIIVFQHPVHGEQSKPQMEAIMEAVASFTDFEFVIFYPNGEAGSEDILGVIKSYPFKAFVNLPYLTFLSLLKISSLIVGNSSCALVEAPFFGVPVVDIGTRQSGRQSNIRQKGIDYNKNAIIEACNIAMNACFEYNNPYNLGIDGAKIIADTLAGL